MATLDPASKLFGSTKPVELFEVRGSDRKKIAEGELSVFSSTPSRAYPMLSAVLQVGDAARWQLSMGSHTMRSASDACEPTFIFSGVDAKDLDLFYCVIFKRAHPAHELELLEQVLGKLSVLHVSKNAKKNQMPFNLPLPQIDPNVINEIMRKGAEDTQMLLKQAGDAANQAFHTAAEMHKKFAPRPADKPVEVSADVRDKVSKTKQAATAGAAVAKGVATGMQAATAEIGTSLVQTVSAAGSSKDGREAAPKKVPEPVAAVGGIGMELLRDIAAVRDAMLDAAGNAWKGAREATIEVTRYQYGEQVAAVTADSCDAVEGVANMGIAMKYAQPTQVVLTSAKETSSRMESKAGAAGAKEEQVLKQQLADERAALEREKAALAAERERLAQQRGQQAQEAAAQQPRKGPFGLPAFGF